MKYFLDTNIFLRTLIKEDERAFSECLNLLEAVKEGKVKAATAHIILAEIAWTLSSYYDFPKAKVTQALEGIINLGGLQIIDGYQARVSLELYKRSLTSYKKKQVKYIDTLIASIKGIQDKKLTIVSYDKEFDRLQVLRKEPHEVI